MSFPVWNSDGSFNKITSTYFKGVVDLSGNLIIRNGTIKSPANTIEFDDVYSYINIPNNLHVLSVFKLDYNSIEYDVGNKVSRIGTMDYNSVYDFNTFSNIYVAGTIQYQESGTGNHIDLIPIVLSSQTSITDIYNNKIGTMIYYAPSDFNIFNNIYCSGQIQYLESGTGNHIDLVPIVLDSKSKLTNITYDSVTNTTSISGLITLPTNSINSTSINNTSFCDLTNAQTIGGVKRFTSNVRIDSAILVNAGATTISNTVLGYISTLSSNAQTQLTGLGTRTTAVETKTTPLTYTSATTTLVISGVLQYTGTLNGWSTTNFSNAINYAKDLTSSAQTQLNTLTTNVTNLQTNSVSLSANNSFTGLNKFTNNLQMEASLLVKTSTSTVTLTNDNLTRIQWLSNVTADIQTSLQTLTDKMAGFYRDGTTGSYFFTSNLNTSGNFNTLQPFEIGYLTGMTENIMSAINTLKTKLTDTSYSSTTTTIANTLASSTLTFSNTLNNISTTTFSYLSGLSGNIQSQLDSLSTRIATFEIVGTIIMSPLNDLQTTTSNKYLMCNGQAVSRTTYSALYAKFGTLFGVGDNSTTFNLPNYSGMFFRGMGTQVINGTTYGNFNSTYAPDQDSVQDHTHAGQAGSYLGTINSSQSIGYRPQISNAPNSYSFTTTGAMNSGRINAFETKPVSIGIYYYVKT